MAFLLEKAHISTFGSISRSGSAGWPLWCRRRGTRQCLGGVGNGWFRREHPIEKWMIFRGSPILGNLHMSWSSWWFGTFCVLPYIGKNPPKWLVFSEGWPNHQPSSFGEFWILLFARFGATLGMGWSDSLNKLCGETVTAGGGNQSKTQKNQEAQSTTFSPTFLGASSASPRVRGNRTNWHGRSHENGNIQEVFSSLVLFLWSISMCFSISCEVGSNWRSLWDFAGHAMGHIYGLFLVFPKKVDGENPYKVVPSELCLLLHNPGTIDITPTIFIK